MAKPITRGGGEWAGCGGLTPLSTLVDQTRVGRWWGGRGAGRGSHTASSRTTCGVATIQHTKREFNQHIQTSLNNWMSLQSLEPSAAAPQRRQCTSHYSLQHQQGSSGAKGARVYASWLTAPPCGTIPVRRREDRANSGERGVANQCLGGETTQQRAREIRSAGRVIRCLNKVKHTNTASSTPAPLHPVYRLYGGHPTYKAESASHRQTYISRGFPRRAW